MNRNPHGEPPSPQSAGVRAALARGDKAVNDLVTLYETGTPEDIATAEWLRGAQVKIDIIRARVSAWNWWTLRGASALSLFHASPLETGRRFE